MKAGTRTRAGGAARRWPWAALIAVAGCGKAVTGPRLAMDDLPAELHGLMVGVSTEQDVVAAWPDAVVKRDQTLGGDTRVAVNDVPAIKITVDDRVRAWLVPVGGVARVASLRVPVEADCTTVLAAFGGRTTPGSCTPSNRRPSPGEHQVCSATPDGATRITITCHDGSLGLWLHVSSATSRHFEG